MDLKRNEKYVRVLGDIEERGLKYFRGGIVKRLCEVFCEVFCEKVLWEVCMEVNKQRKYPRESGKVNKQN
jgi:hypothetical protein